jgi:hypothetical protein
MEEIPIDLPYVTRAPIERGRTVLAMGSTRGEDEMESRGRSRSRSGR